MNTRLAIAGLFFIAILVSAFHKNYVEDTIPSILKTDSTRLSAIRPNVSSVDSFMITSNANWTVAITPAAATWLTVSPARGNGNAKIYVRVVQSNAASTTQTASVVITSSDASIQPVTMPVTQKQFNPHLIWSKLYGGSGYELINAVIQTTDGGYIGAGIN